MSSSSIAEDMSRLNLNMNSGKTYTTSEYDYDMHTTLIDGYSDGEDDSGYDPDDDLDDYLDDDKLDEDLDDDASSIGGIDAHFEAVSASSSRSASPINQSSSSSAAPSNPNREVLVLYNAPFRLQHGGRFNGTWLYDWMEEVNTNADGEKTYQYSYVYQLHREHMVINGVETSFWNRMSGIGEVVGQFDFEIGEEKFEFLDVLVREGDC